LNVKIHFLDGKHIWIILMNPFKTFGLTVALILSVFSASAALAQRRALPAPDRRPPMGNPDTRPSRPIQRDGDERRPQPRQEINPEREIERIERDRQFQNPGRGGEVNPGNRRTPTRIRTDEKGNQVID
jgi:hypothetical protein